MPTAGEYLGQQIARAGNELSGLGVAVYKVDAENKYLEKTNEIAKSIEEFKQTLWQDPDSGTPGEDDGYVKKWNEFSQNIEKEIGKTKNPLARQKTEQYWQQAKLEQSGEIARQQFTSWAGKTKAATGKRILEMIETSGLDEQTKLDTANSELLFLKEHNLVSDDEYNTSLANYSQAILRKGMNEKAKAIYETEGLAAAQKFIMSDTSTYAVGTSTFTAGDQVKNLVQQDLKGYDAAIQDERWSLMQSRFGNIMLNASGKELVGDGQILTFENIQKDPQLNAEGKLFWEGQLRGYWASVNSGEKSNADAIAIENRIQFAVGEYQRALAKGAGGKTMLNLGVGPDGKEIAIPATKEGIRQYYSDNIGILTGYAGSIGRMNPLIDSLDKVADTGKSTIAYGLDYFDDKKLDPSQRANMQRQLQAWMDKNPDAANNVDKLTEQAKKIRSATMYTPRVKAAFEFHLSGGKGDSDLQIMTSQWDSTLPWQFGADNNGDNLQPIAYQSKAAFDSFAAGFLKTVESRTGKKISDLGTPSWIPLEGKQGSYTYSISGKDSKSGSQITYMAVPIVYPSGERDTGMLRSTESKTGEVKREIFVEEKNGKGKWKEVTRDGNLKSNGWAVMTAGELLQYNKDAAAKKEADAKAAMDRQEELTRKIAAEGALPYPTY